MISAHDFLEALAVVLCVAAVTTVVFQRLRQPVVLGYIFAGLIIGPHVPIPLVADTKLIEALSELGVILVMFSLGLEFSFKQLKQVGSTAGLTAVIECSIMLSLGFGVGRLMGWSVTESIFTGAIVAISSTTIIVKTFDEQGIVGKLREWVIGILVVEDLIAILLLTTLTAISSGKGLEAYDLLLMVGKLAAFLAVLVGVGLMFVPRMTLAVLRLNRPETTLVASVGFCFSVALLAQHFGYSVALGAFIAGSLISESGEGKTVEHLVQPVRDLFAAVFFVSVGMLIDPTLVIENWKAIAVLTVVVITGKTVNVALGSFLTGRSTRKSVQAGMSLAQIGEFSFILAGLGLSLSATRGFLYPVAATVSAITTLSTGWMVRASGPVASWIDRKLPRRVQTFTTLYASWLEQLGERPKDAASSLGRKVWLLVLDAAVLVTVIIGTAVGRSQLPATVPGWVPIAVAIALSVPLCIGIFRMARRLGIDLAEAALPAGVAGKVDLAAAPRRALVVTLQVAIVLTVGLPMVAVTQPFLTGFPGVLVLLGVLTVLGVAFWRSTTNLEGHVRAGAEVMIEALVAQSRRGLEPSPASRPTAESGTQRVVPDVQQLLPGLGTPVLVELVADSPGVGKTLAQLDLRGVTGATVLAIMREAAGVIVPTAKEVLQVGDRLALTGSREAVDAASGLLRATS